MIVTAFALAQTDQYGGTLAIKREATGFFRIEKIENRWMFVTPEGHGYVALGVNHIGKFMQGQSESLLARFNGDRRQANLAIDQALHDLGLNAGEAYAPFWQELPTKRPWVANINYPGDREGKFDAFDPQWQAATRSIIIEKCREVADDPFVLGIAFADVPNWGEKRVAFYESLPNDAPGKKVLTQYRMESKSDEEFLAHVADTLYGFLKFATREGAPHHLFFGERLVVRMVPDKILHAMGKHIDVLATQAIALSPHRPPDWQTFQFDGWNHEYELLGKPILIIDWAAAFSTREAFDTPRGRLKTEADATEDAVEWISQALAHPGIVGLFRCQLAGTHVNDHFFNGPAKRTYLRDDGTPFEILTKRISLANREALQKTYANAGGSEQ
jgi:hypothetical protein